MNVEQRYNQMPNNTLSTKYVARHFVVRQLVFIEFIFFGTRTLVTLVKTPLDRLVPESRDDEWPPIYEPYRCLEDGRISHVPYEGSGRQSEDCPLVTDDICQGHQFYPMPCESKSISQ